MAGVRLGVYGSLFGGEASSGLGTVLGVWFEGLGLMGYLLVYLTTEPQIPQALRQLECTVGYLRSCMISFDNGGTL